MRQVLGTSAVMVIPDIAIFRIALLIPTAGVVECFHVGQDRLVQSSCGLGRALRVVSRIDCGELGACCLAGFALKEDKPPGHQCPMVWHARRDGEESSKLVRARSWLAECGGLHRTASFEDRQLGVRAPSFRERGP
jgi:hypothetical protein